MPEPSRSKLLYLVHRMPYPPDKGDRIRNFQILRWLAERASVHLLCLRRRDHRRRVGEDSTRLWLIVSGLFGCRHDGGGLAPPRLLRGRTATEGEFDSAPFRELLDAGLPRRDMTLSWPRHRAWSPTSESKSCRTCRKWWISSTSTARNGSTTPRRSAGRAPGFIELKDTASSDWSGTQQLGYGQRFWSAKLKQLVPPHLRRPQCLHDIQRSGSAVLSPKRAGR